MTQVEIDVRIPRSDATAESIPIGCGDAFLASPGTGALFWGRTSTSDAYSIVEPDTSGSPSASTKIPGYPSVSNPPRSQKKRRTEGGGGTHFAPLPKRITLTVSNMIVRSKPSDRFLM